MALGYKHTPEALLKIGLASKGRNKSIQCKKIMSIKMRGNQNAKGAIRSEEFKNRVRLVKGDIHPNWKGDGVGYGALHIWIVRNFGKATKCENTDCKYPRLNRRGKMMLEPKRYEWANKTGHYLRDRNDWMMLCPSCHRLNDKKFNIKKNKK